MSETRPPALSRWPSVADVALALLVAALSVVGAELSLTDDTQDAQAPSWGGLLLLLSGSLVLAVRTPAPVLVLVVSAGTSVVYHSLGYRPLPLPLAVLVAMYTVVLVRPLAGAAAAGLYVVATGSASVSSPLRRSRPPGSTGCCGPPASTCMRRTRRSAPGRRPRRSPACSRSRAARRC